MGNDSGSENTERSERPARSERSEGARRERGENGRGERAEGGRRERGERRQERAPAEIPMGETPAVVDGQEAAVSEHDGSHEHNGERRERRSRDRFGRDRRERTAETSTDVVADGAAPQAPTEVAEAPSADRPQRSYFERATPAQAVDNTPAPQAPQAAPAPVAAPTMAPVPAPAPAAVVSAAAVPTSTLGMPRVGSYSLPIESLIQIASSSGLQWVNSDTAKIAAVQAAIAAEPKPVHVPRERPPAAVIQEGPLVLVETRKDLKDMNLPF